MQAIFICIFDSKLLAKQPSNYYFMNNSKLLLLLKSIDKSKFKKLIDFSKNPYFNTNDKVILLVKYITKYAPDFEHEALLKAKCFKAIFPRETFNDSKLRKVMSRSFKLIEQFVLYQEIEQKEYLQEAILTRYYRANNIESLFVQKAKSWEQKLDSLRIEEQYFQQYEFSYEQANMLSEQVLKNMNKQGKIEYYNKIQETINSLQHFFFFRILYLYSTLQVYAFSINIATPKEEMLSFVQQINEDVLKEHPFILFYYKTLLMLIHEDNDEHYQTLQKRVKNYAFEEKDKFFIEQLYKTLELYCIRKIKKGEDEYYEELFGLYMYELEHNLTFIEGDFMPVKYRNIVAAGLKVNQFDKVKEFIQTYSPQLPKELSEGLSNYSMALLHLHQKKYKNALEFLHQVDTKGDLILKINIKRILIMIYYELNEIDVLDSSMNAFRTSMSRDEHVSNHRKTTNQNFINILYRLINTQLNDLEKLHRIKSELESEKIIEEREWLLEKVNQRILIEQT